MEIKKISLVLLCSTLLMVLNGCEISSERYEVNSPDEKLKISIFENENGEYVYSFKGNGKQLIDESLLGFELKNGERIPSANWVVENTDYKQVKDVWKPIWGKRAEVDEYFNEMIMTLHNTSSRGMEKLLIVARAYNDGVAFRYELPSTEDNTEDVSSEQTEYNFAGDYTAWSYNGEDHNIGPEKLTDSNGKRLPVMTVKADAHNYMAIHEAYLKEGEPLRLYSKKGETLFSVSSKPAKLYPGYSSAWRVILYGKTPGVLVDSHLIELLNPKPESGYDFSWVKPGVALWDWRMNGAQIDGFVYEMSYPSWIRSVDFAAEQGFTYLVLDANWYGPEFDSESNPTTGDKAKDVRKLIEYAKEKNVGIWLYLNDVGGKRFPIEETLKQYREWGAVGVKYGFMSGGHEEKNHWTQTVTRLCAENHLLVDYHDDPVHPYGQMRTWPNAVTREYCHAQLDGFHVFVPETFVTSVFVNMIAGPLDMNNGMFDLRQGKTTRADFNFAVPSTVTSEAARTLITFSGATILPDIPEFYKKYPSLLRFISEQKMPWVESKTLSGEIGEYIVMMRQTLDAYLIGMVTNELARTIEVPLSFLPQGDFVAQITEDGEHAHYLVNREDYKVMEKKVNSKSILKLELAAGGGACILIKSK